MEGQYCLLFALFLIQDRLFFEREKDKKYVYERQSSNEIEALAEAMCVSHFA